MKGEKGHRLDPNDAVVLGNVLEGDADALHVLAGALRLLEVSPDALDITFRPGIVNT